MRQDRGVIIDCDQHLVEGRELWRDHIDPAALDDALRLEDDELGYTWLCWRDRRLDLADVHRPGDTASMGALRQRQRAGLPAEGRYDDLLPRDHWDPGARVERLDAMGVNEAVVFPNYGLLWHRRLADDRTALEANMAAWNRWCASVVTDSRGRLHPVAHLDLRDPAWVERQLRELSAGGVRLAMVAPALVDGRPLSHPDHDAMWRAFVEHGVTPLFHVADQPRVFDDGWYGDTSESLIPALDSVFLWTPPALAITDLVLNGVFERIPQLRIGVIELSAIWVPMFLLMLDGGWDFTAKLNGCVPAELRQRPSAYVQEHVRIAAFSYEDPARLTRQAGDLFMACSDYPHSEGTATPLADYARGHLDPSEAPDFFGANIRTLLD